MALVAAADFDRIKAGAQRFASGFTVGQKMVTGVAILALVIGGIVFMGIAGKPSYGVLFSNLKAADASSITAKLDTAKVPYQLTDGGTTILVPSNDVDLERINMASAGLPAGNNVGLSLLDKEGITTSEETQSADYQQAIQGELASTIEGISGVQTATVNVALPTANTFAVKTQSPTGASVLMTMDAGQVLTAGQVQAIVHLVASSVPNLDPNSVTVSDSSGNLLAGPGVNNGLGQQSDAQSAYDDTVQAKILALLSPVLGQNNADIQVASTLNFDSTTDTINGIQRDPNGVAVTAPQSTTTSSEILSSGATSGVALGSVTPTSIVTTTPGSSYTTGQASTTNEIGTTQDTVTVPPGAVSQQSVAVLVNSKALPANVSLASLQGEIANAVGINATRGDTIDVTSMPFSTAIASQAAQQAAAAAAAAHRAELYSIIRGAVVALIILIALFLLWRSAKKARAVHPPISMTSALGFPMDALSPMDSTMEVPAIQIGQTNDTPKIELGQDMATFIDSQPEDVATLLRSWMHESPASTSIKPVPAGRLDAGAG